MCYWVDLDAPDAQAENVAWIYHDPKQGYEFIKNQIGFYARETRGTTAAKT